MKKIIIAGMIILGLGGCTPKFWEQVKDSKSDIMGLDRKITIYGEDGKVIREWEGKGIRLKDSESGGRNSFILDGKRIVIDGGVVVIEER